MDRATCTVLFFRSRRSACGSRRSAASAAASLLSGSLCLAASETRRAPPPPAFAALRLSPARSASPRSARVPSLSRVLAVVDRRRARLACRPRCVPRVRCLNGRLGGLGNYRLDSIPFVFLACAFR